jgi:hypothetical protein
MRRSLAKQDHAGLTNSLERAGAPLQALTCRLSNAQPGLLLGLAMALQGQHRKKAHALRVLSFI